ncbi:ABC transporter ATP-binding protein [Euzebya rosea]|uniref:ABC transporter ATP-binding protein n=1 Tax=Euzebya rosea TaxID=2052804 RepID=UPI000D3E25AB|nr:ABC transporter ATP-binding protein [Euzebya rosea]
MSDALELRGLHRRYGDVRAVDGVDLAVADGERFALLGPSGSGKTTILRLVAGFERPDEGRVVLAGQDVVGLPPERRSVGVVFQDYALFPHRTVSQNIAFGLRMRKVDRETRRARVAELLKLVGLTREADRRPDQLSGGQRQRVALARALAPNPSLLLLDEPLANLDRRLRESLRDELVTITDAVGITTVLVTHDQEEALSFADRIGVLSDGRLVQVGTPAEVWRSPVSTVVATFLGDMNLLPARVVDGGVVVTGLPTPVAVRGGVPTGPSGGVPDSGVPDGGVLACVRPEALDVLADPDGPGTVVAVAYAGGSTTHRIDVDGTRLTVRTAQPDGLPVLAVGDRVAVRVLVDAVRLLPADGSTRG